MEGMAAVQARIATIEARFAALAPRAAPPTTATAPARFDDVLAGALRTSASTAAAASSTALRPAERLAPGEYGRLEPPAALVGYGNGRIPAEALSPIGDGQHRLYAPAAASFRAMTSDAAAAGVTIGVTDSYRDYDAQVRLAEEKGLYENGGLAARPGTSNHGWGLALDLDLDAGAQSWMREHGWRYGFVESVPREPWHFEYRPAGRGS